MGNWKLEVGRMFLYMAFPVAMFHYFNQPEFFEEWVIKVKQEMYPPDITAKSEEYRRLLEEHNIKQELARLKALEKEHS